MPDFRYRALTQTGEVVSGVISANSTAEVASRMDYLRLAPVAAIEEVTKGTGRAATRLDFGFGKPARAEDVTTFTRDLALLLKAGARLDDALELLATDVDIGRLRTAVAKVRSSVLSGESLADSLARNPDLFPGMYVALVRVGEASGALPHMLDVLASERARAEALRRKLTDAIRYPLFVLFAAACVLVFFLMFVLPQFATVLRDFEAKIDPLASFFLDVSERLNAHTHLAAFSVLLLLVAGLYTARQPKLRAAMLARLQRLPLIRTSSVAHRSALFCRNLGVLLTAGVPLTHALRILVEMMASMGEGREWTGIVERVRQGRKLSDVLGEAAFLPAMAIRMLRLGEETGQLPILAQRVAEFYETKLQRSLDRLVAFVGPLAIIAISVIVGGLIVSLMTSLLSVSQLVG